jgi:hypothetical protein
MMRLPKVLTAGFGQRQMHAYAGELGFRDFSSLSLVKENRRHLGNPACCISLDVALCVCLQFKELYSLDAGRNPEATELISRSPFLPGRIYTWPASSTSSMSNESPTLSCVHRGTLGVVGRGSSLLWSRHSPGFRASVASTGHSVSFRTQKSVAAKCDRHS